MSDSLFEDSPVSPRNSLKGVENLSEFLPHDGRSESKSSEIYVHPELLKKMNASIPIESSRKSPKNSKNADNKGVEESGKEPEQSEDTSITFTIITRDAKGNVIHIKTVHEGREIDIQEEIPLIADERNISDRIKRFRRVSVTSAAIIKNERKERKLKNGPRNSYIEAHMVQERGKVNTPRKYLKSLLFLCIPLKLTVLACQKCDQDFSRWESCVSREEELNGACANCFYIDSDPRCNKRTDTEVKACIYLNLSILICVQTI